MHDKIQAPEPCFFAILREGSCYLPGPGDPGNAGENQLNAHVRYMSMLLLDGAVSFCGPVTDNTDAKWVAIFPTQDRQRVIDFLEEDPDVRSRRLGYEIHPVAGMNAPVRAGSDRTKKQ